MSSLYTPAANVGLSLAVVGANSLSGMAILERVALDPQRYPEIFVLATSAFDGEVLEVEGRHFELQDVDYFDFSLVDAAIFCGQNDGGLAAVQRASAACWVIDDDARSRTEDVPLAAAGINDQAYLAPKVRRVANPNGVAWALAEVLAACGDEISVKALDVVTMQSVSGNDMAGVEELAQQSQALFGQKEYQEKIYPKRIAFNLWPQIGELTENGASREEEKIATELARILEHRVTNIHASCVRVPVFYGHAAMVHVRTEQEVDFEKLQKKLSASAWVDFQPSSSGALWPTPMDAVNGETLSVARLRPLQHSTPGFSFWLVFDNLHLAVAKHILAIIDLKIGRLRAH